MQQILTDRSVLKINGKDREKFFQSIITNDINKLQKDRIIYTYLLTPQGKFLHDFFVYNIDDYYLIDIAKIAKDDFIKFINFYKLQADITISEIDMQILSHISDWEVENGLIFTDPRNNNMGNRTLVNLDYTVDKEDEYDYEYLRIKNTVAEGHKDLIPKKDFILEFNAEELNAVSFTKGCYIGQEVVTRTKNRGVVRKFIKTLSCDINDEPSFGQEIIVDNLIGEVRSKCKDLMLVIFKQNI